MKRPNLTAYLFVFAVLSSSYVANELDKVAASTKVHRTVASKVSHQEESKSFLEKVGETIEVAWYHFNNINKESNSTEDLDQSITKLRQAVEEVEKNADNVSFELKAKRAELLKVKSDLKQQKSKNKKISESNLKLEKKVKDLEKEVQMLSDTDSAIKDLSDKIKKLEESNEFFKQAYHDAIEQIEKLKEEKKNYEDAYDQLALEYQKSLDENERLKCQVESSTLVSDVQKLATPIQEVVAEVEKEEKKSEKESEKEEKEEVAEDSDSQDDSSDDDSKEKKKRKKKKEEQIADFFELYKRNQEARQLSLYEALLNNQVQTNDFGVLGLLNNQSSEQKLLENLALQQYKRELLGSLLNQRGSIFGPSRDLLGPEVSFLNESRRPKPHPLSGLLDINGRSTTLLSHQLFGNGHMIQDQSQWIQPSSYDFFSKGFSFGPTTPVSNTFTNSLVGNQTSFSGIPAQESSSIQLF